jgi:hypothetical protein
VGWWPATNTEPQSAATIELLRFFRLLNLNGALAASEFYRSLEDLTDPEGIMETTKKAKAASGSDAEDIPVSCVYFLMCAVVQLKLLCRSAYAN